MVSRPNSQAVEKNPASGGEKIFLDFRVRSCGLGKLGNHFGEVTLQTASLVAMEEVHFRALVDQRNRARKQFLSSSLFMGVAELLDRCASGQQPVPVTQTTNGVLANPFLGTGVISHINLS